MNNERIPKPFYSFSSENRKKPYKFFWRIKKRNVGPGYRIWYIRWLVRVCLFPLQFQLVCQGFLHLSSAMWLCNTHTFFYFARLVLDPYICGLYFIFFLFTVVMGFRGTRKPMTLTDPNNLEPLAMRFSHPTRSPPGSLASRTIPLQCFCPDLGWSLPGRPLASTLTLDRATELSPSFPLSPLVACTKTTCEEYFIIHSLLSNRGNTPKTNKRWLNPTDVC